MGEKAGKISIKLWILRILDFADIIGLVIAQAISMRQYNQRKQYRIEDGYMVAQGQLLSSCNLSEAYRYSDAATAQRNVDVINGFTVAPLILVVLNLIVDFILSARKLFGKVTPQQDHAITKLQLFLTFFFTPLCFPLADFSYSECIETGLNDSIMNQLGTYSTIGFTMLACLAIIVAMIIVVGVCLKDSRQDRQKCYKCLMLIGFVIVMVYAGIALMFLVFAFIGTLISLGTGILIGVGGLVQGYELYCSYQQCKDAANKIGLGN